IHVWGGHARAGPAERNLFQITLTRMVSNACRFRRSRPPRELHESDPLSPEELEALRKSVEKEARTELGPAIELVEIGDVATIEYSEKELGIRERLRSYSAASRSGCGDEVALEDEIDLIPRRYNKRFSSRAIIPCSPLLVCELAPR